MNKDGVSVEVKFNIPEAKKAMSQIVHEAMNDAAITIHREATNRVPSPGRYGVGNLKASLNFRVEASDGVVFAIVGTQVEYAPYVELGTGIYAEGGKGRKTPWMYKNRKGEWIRTVGQKPQPFLRPALDENADRLKAYIENKIMSSLASS